MRSVKSDNEFKMPYLDRLSSKSNTPTSGKSHKGPKIDEKFIEYSLDISENLESLEIDTHAVIDVKEKEEQIPNVY